MLSQTEVKENYDEAAAMLQSNIRDEDIKAKLAEIECQGGLPAVSSYCTGRSILASDIVDRIRWVNVAYAARALNIIRNFRDFREDG